MVTSKTIKVKWGKRNKAIYTEKGYRFTKYGDKFNICIKDLPVHSNVKIIAKCDICGKEKEITFQNYNFVVKNNSKYICNKCKNNYEKQPLKKSTEQFKEEVKKTTDGEYTVLSKYKNSYTKLLIKHNKCGNCYYVTPNNFLNGNRCPYCAIIVQKNVNIIINEQLKLKYKNKFEILTPYKNAKEKILIKCLTCGAEYYVTPNILKNQLHMCKNCKLKLRNSKQKAAENIASKTKEKQRKITNWNDSILANTISQITNGEYMLIGHYKKSIIPVKIIHNKCGFAWNIRLHDFIDKGCRCPKCYTIKRCKELGISINEWGKSSHRDRIKLERWSKKVRKRDGEKCTICGNTKGLNAHHLNGWNWDIKNRDNVNNGITLCEECHQKFHNEYGYGNNTKEQFIKFTEQVKELGPNIQIIK